MKNYTNFNARHVSALLLIRAKSGIRPPVMRNLRAEHFIKPRGSAFSGRYYKVVEE